MTCKLNVKTPTRLETLFLPSSRVHINTCQPLKKLFLHIEYINKEKQEEMETGYFDTINLHYDAASNCVIVDAVLSNSIHNNSTEVSNG